MTVSRVINGNVRVSEDMQRRVLASIKALDFSINVAAQSTRSRVANVKIGILYSNPSAHYLNELLVGSLEQASKMGCQLILESCAGLPSQTQAVNRLVEQRVEGVILPPPLCDSEPIVHSLLKRGIQVLSLASAAPVEETSAVRIDDFEAALSMTRYLIKLGHRRIAFIKGDPQHTPALVRYYGFCTAMRNAGIEIDESLVAEGLFTYQSGLEAAQKLLRRDDRPTAVFASNDDMAAAVLGVAHGMQLAVPGDLSVCGFDDTLIATTTWPPLTTIHQPIGEMGRTAIRTLIDQIRHQSTGKAWDPTHQVMKYALMERGSTGPSPDQTLYTTTGRGGVPPR